MQMQITEEERKLIENYRASRKTDRGNLNWMAEVMARVNNQKKTKGG